MTGIGAAGTGMPRDAVVTVVLGAHPAGRAEVARLIGRNRVHRSRARQPHGVAQELRAVAVARDLDRIVLECGSGTVAHEALHCAEGPGLRIGSVIAVADGEVLLRDLERADVSAGSCRRPPGVLSVDHVEHADAVVVVAWRALDRPTLERLLSLLAHLNPDARLTLARGAPGWAAGLLAAAPRQGHPTPGWVRLLNCELDPIVTGGGVSAVRYEQLRPFHPERLLAVLGRGFEHRHGRLLRSSGLCRLATRPDTVGRWDQVGRVVAFDPLPAAHPSGEPVAIGQELAFFGIGLDAASLAADLDRAALTDGELADGPAVWRTYADPLPGWHLAA